MQRIYVDRINWCGMASDFLRPSFTKKLTEYYSNKEFSNNCIILVSGCNEYISFINTCIEKWLKGSKINNIKIINFFELTEFNSDIVNILDNHDKILNTSGEREITDVFTGYNNNSKRIINDN